MSIVPIQVGMCEKILNAGVTGAVEVDTAVDTSQTPHILVLKIRAVTEFMYLTGQQVLSRTEIGGDIKLSWAPGILVDAYLRAVYIYIDEIGASLEMKNHSPPVP
jgi:hypothetical protein